MNKQVRALKPCPFCGEKEKINGAAKDPFDEWSKVLIECETDGARGSVSSSWCEAEESWNKRTEEKGGETHEQRHDDPRM